MGGVPFTFFFKKKAYIFDYTCISTLTPFLYMNDTRAHMRA